ncbi:hypothetical protein EV182_006743 [Spiromyces aspiralis]|uniref:Uncharacterized protein n=1 Tax=Spiromyces aspiralis TaxID=68401 RepID=A0ACC1HLG6_9FUNG|nr:hypothetical protein EV182_006743 [Spiromyces aspiralis]
MTGWDELTGPGAPQEPTQAMEQLVREIRKLHKVLKKYLQPRDLTIVMQYIYEMYEQKLSECTESLMPELGGRGGRRLASELDFFLQRMRSLDTQVAGRAGRLEALMTELKSKGAEEEVYASPSAAAEGTGNEQRRGNSANSTDDC